MWSPLWDARIRRLPVHHETDNALPLLLRLIICALIMMQAPPPWTHKHAPSFILAFCFLAGISVASLPVVTLAAEASVSITEIMYDLPGADPGREWIEVQNTGSEEVSFISWKLFEANTNHSLSLYQGNATTTQNGFAIIADDPVKFLADNPSYSGTLFGSSFSLSNSGETLELRFGGAGVYQTSYASASGAGGDGNSLQWVNASWQQAAPTPGAAAPTTLPSPQSNQIDTASTTEASAAEETIPTPAPAALPAQSFGSTWSFKPQVYVNAFVPKEGVAGAPVTFDAAAAGVKKEPLTNARFVWSFGDGGTIEGKRVEHTYHYPGKYVVMVTAASGEWNATDRKEVAIAAPALVLSALKEGSDGFIELRNDSIADTDLSHWLLQSGAGTFAIPQGTVIGAKNSIPFPAAITNLLADRSNTALLYPNGMVVTVFTETNNTPEPEALPVSTPAPIPITAPVAVAVATPVAASEPPQTRQPEVRAAEPSVTLNAKETDSVIASSTSLVASVGTVGDPSLIPWLGGVTLLVLLGSGGYVMVMRPKRESTADTLRKEAAMYNIVEEQ